MSKNELMNNRGVLYLNGIPISIVLVFELILVWLWNIYGLYTHTQWHIIQPCDNMNGHWGDFTEWNTTVWYHLLVYMKSKRAEHRVEWWLPGANEWGKWGMLVKEYRLSVGYKMKKFWWI